MSCLQYEGSEDNSVITSFLSVTKINHWVADHWVAVITAS